MNHPSSTRPAIRAAHRLCMTSVCLLLAPAAIASTPVNDASAERPVVDIAGNLGSQLPDHLRQVKHTGQMQLQLREGNLLQLPRPAAKILVADPTIASFQVPSPNSVFVFAQAAGTTTLYALDARDEVIAAIRVIAQHDVARLSEQIMRSVPGAKIELEAVSNDRMIVRGNVRTPLEARQVVEQVQTYLETVSTRLNASSSANARVANNPTFNVINQLKVELSSQVNIQVRVVEVSRTLAHELGFNWASILNTGSGSWGIMSGSAGGAFAPVTTPSPSLFDSVTGTNMSQLIPGSTAARFAAGGFSTRGRFTLGGLISALSTEGFASVLAEPNLTAMSGESAAFAAGGEVPIVILTNNNVQIEYKSYGVILRMTPTLLSPNRISLHIAPEVSELTEDGAVNLGGLSIPAFKVRRTDTTVELASGQSFALAGMLRSTSAQTVSGVPGLSNIPWLGRLFEHESSERAETELVFLVTAHVVNPVTGGELQVPGQGLPFIDAQLPQQAPIGYLY